MTASNLAGAAVNAAASAASGATVGLATMMVLGIPMGALAAALIGGGLAYVAREREPDELIPARLLGILSDALIGGWFAVALVKLTVLHRFGIDAIPLEAIAGLLAIFWRQLRLWIPEKANEAFAAFLSWWGGRGRTGGTP
jgi:hypothetical protein